MSFASSSRHDGRSATDIRPVISEFGQLDRADGSGRFGFGSSSALASVTGPIEVRLREELPDKATFEIVHRPLEGISATPSRAIINTLQAVFPPLLNLGQHPRSLVQLVVQSLSAAPSTDLSASTLSAAPSTLKSWPPPTTDTPSMVAAPMSGSFFSSRSAIINASTLALLDAGSISIRAIPISISLAYIPQRSSDDETLISDPTNKEETEASSRHVFAWAFGTSITSEEKAGTEVEGEEQESELVYVESEGSFTRQQLENALQEGKRAARGILASIRERFGEHLQKRIQRP